MVDWIALIIVVAMFVGLAIGFAWGWSSCKHYREYDQ